MTNANVASFTPTAGQDEAIKRFREFMRTSVDSWQVFSLCGYAGTGKTTLVRYLVDVLRERYGSEDDEAAVRVVAPTGKAASVLRAKGFAGATTVHALLYTPITVGKYNDAGDYIGQELQFELKLPEMEQNTKLIVVDEASMVDGEMARDLRALRIKILAIGDPFQLPPVRPYGSAAPLLDENKPDAMLTEVTRQAGDSPVLHLATVIRQRHVLLRGTIGDSVVCSREQAADLSFTGDAPFIVGLNRTRHMQNHSIRKLLGRKTWEPEIGDRLLCRRNDRRSGLVNGELYQVVHAYPHSQITKRLTLAIRAEGDPSLDDPDVLSTTEREVHAWTHLFQGEDGEAELGRMMLRARRQCQELTYGYAITCHASQGSEWPTVVVIDEGQVFKEYRWRWIYTAITRASERVAVIS
jgi:exodeoxyribonuclease-5